jgi:hypothetical protein
VIFGFTNAGVSICRAGKVHVKDTTVRDCGSGIGAGFCFPNSTGMIEMLVEHCRVERTRGGGAIGASSGAQVTVRDTPSPVTNLDSPLTLGRANPRK